MKKNADKKTKIKLPSLFTKKYTEKKYRKKILAKVFVPADRQLIESLFVSAPDPKKGDPRFTLNGELVRDKDLAKRLGRIAKEIKKQKGRVKIASVLAALLCVAVLVAVLVVFRNQIARKAIVSAFQGTFGAKCEIADLDVNLLDTHFTLDGLAVANRSKPMTNLFEVGHLEFYFDLLELTRGKFVAETVEITGIAWKTARTVDGTLPPAAEKAYRKKQKAASSKPNPVQEKLNAELEKIKSGISVDSGITAIKDQLDPAKYIEREKAALLTPAVVAEIQAAVPGLTGKWQTKAADARKEADTVIADTKAVVAINPKAIKTAEEAKAALEAVNKAGESVKGAVELTGGILDDVNRDAETVKALSAKAEGAIKADSARLKALAESVKSVNLDTGSRFVSGLFDVFVMNALGTYYPYFNKGVAMLSGMQTGAGKTKKETAQTLKQKSSAINRIPGRDFAFGDDSLPKLVMRNIALSANDASIGLAGSAGVRNVTNDQDKLGKPLSFDAALTHGTMGEKVSGVADFRDSATERLDAKFDVGGYSLKIDGGDTPGVPSLSGTAGAVGTLVLSPDETVTIETGMRITGTDTTVPAFEPAFIYEMYTGVLASIDVIDLDIRAVISPDRDIDLSVESGVDGKVYEALKKAVAQKLEEVKAEIRKYAESWIAGQKEAYASEIAQFNDVSAKAKKAVEDVKNGEKIVNDKKAELEARSREIVKEYAAQADAAVKEAAAAAKAAADKAAAEAKAAADAEAQKQADAAKKAAAEKLKGLF